MQKITIGNVSFIKDQKKGAMLFLKREREPMGGLYTGLGGKTDFGEDIHSSALREIKEESGLQVFDLKLKGVVKTLLDGKDSSWILFIYTADKFSGELKPCPEGELQWVPLDKIYSLELIGFIRALMPYILKDKGLLQGTICHDERGTVLRENYSSL